MSKAFAAIVIILILALVAAQTALFIWVYRRIKYGPRVPFAKSYRWFICGAILLYIVSISFALHTTHLLATGNTATGTVVEMRVRSNKNGTTYAPTFTFLDESGATQRIDSTLHSNPPDYKVGDQIPVLYRTDNPSSARINSFAENWFVSILTAALATIYLAVVSVHRLWTTRLKT